MGGVKGKERKYQVQVVSRKGRKGHSKMDGRLEGENGTILGLQVQYGTRTRSLCGTLYIAQLSEWCPHDRNALS